MPRVPDTDELEALLALSEVDLLELIGRELIGESRGLGPTGRHRSVGAGTRWLEDWLGQNRKKLCDHEKIRPYLVDGEWGMIEDLSAVIDFLLNNTGKPSPVTVAVIVAKRGLGKVCRPEPVE